MDYLKKSKYLKKNHRELRKTFRLPPEKPQLGLHPGTFLVWGIGANDLATLIVYQLLSLLFYRSLVGSLTIANRCWCSCSLYKQRENQTYYRSLWSICLITRPLGQLPSSLLMTKVIILAWAHTRRPHTVLPREPSRRSKPAKRPGLKYACVQPNDPQHN